MVLTGLYIILTVAFIFFIPVVIIKRKKAGVTGIRTALPAICLLLLVLTIILSYWFNFMGLISWSVGFILLILAAYFTKYMPVPEDGD